jgi:TRAP-type C4-dicarboxylate transport system substrate-binding protein
VPADGVELRIGIADAPARFTDDVALEFARLVALESGGDVEVEIVRLDTWEQRGNQQLAESLIDGHVEFALVPAQAWDALDSSALTALYVPSLVTSDELIDEIAMDGIARDMLAGLDRIGVKGLALIPGGIRHLFASTHPLQLGNGTGMGIRAAYSEAMWTTFRALGMQPRDLNGSALDRALNDGTVVAVDSMFRIADGFLDAPAVWGNLATAPHALTLVTNPATYGRLSASQRESIGRAAAGVAAWSVAERPRDADEARRLCDRAAGSVVALATDSMRDRWELLLARARDQILADPAVAAMAGRIRELDAALGHPVSAVAACQGRPIQTSAGQPHDNVPEEFPEGIYRRRVTAADLEAAGVDASTAAVHAGVWTLQFEDGVYVDEWCPDSTYSIVHERVVVTMGTRDSCGEAAGGVLFSAGWRLEGGSLTFTDVRAGSGSQTLLEAAVGGGEWVRVG